MSLQETIKTDLVRAMKEKDEERKNALRVMLGEFSRQERKELPDDEVIRIMKKLLKAEKELLDKSGASSPSRFLEIVEAYLPKMADDAEIEAWIRENVDFAAFRNKMQAMGTIMKHFGSRADGNRVKQLLQRI